MSQSQERRVRTSASLRARTSNNGGTVVEGYALTYNTRTLIGRGKGSFHEVLSPGAARMALSRSDIRLLFNHQGMPLARTKSGTLSLREDSKGVFFSAQLDADSPDAQALASAINRADIDGCSFAFRVADNGDTWDDFDCDDSETCCGQPGSVLRTINEIGEMFDVSCVSFPAYPGTSVSSQPVEDLSQNVAFAGAVVPAEVRSRAASILARRLSPEAWRAQAEARLAKLEADMRAERVAVARDEQVIEAVGNMDLRSQTALDEAFAADLRLTRLNARRLANPSAHFRTCEQYLEWHAEFFRGL